MLFNLKRLCVLAVALQAHGVQGQGWDGPTPYGDGTAPDVNATDVAWDNYYPAFEGTTAPNWVDSDDSINATDPAPDISRRAAKNFYLRVMPLGASITEGVKSTDGNGYRKWLRSQLRWKGWNVNMVGSKQNGNMADKDNEGHQGWVISEIQTAWQSVAWMKPNLVLINAGTNDCNYDRDPGNAGGRLKLLIDDIFTSVPGVTVIVSTLVRSKSKDSCVVSVNQQFKDLVNNQYQGKRIAIADIYDAMTMSQLDPDGIHPTDEGYKVFAAVWWDAISRVEDGIQPPATDNGIDDTRTSSPRTCSKVAGNARGPIQTQKGSGHDDGNYIHDRKERGAILSARIEKRDDPKSITDAIPWHMFFANLVLNNPNAARSEARDEWIRIFHDADGKNTYYYRQNMGDGTFGPSTTFNVDMDCDAGPLYAFADFNNDGLDDFFCLKAGSAVWVSLNRGGNPPRFESIGQVVPTHDGFLPDHVRIADIDGDGRADYCLVKDDGDVLCSRNGGQGDSYFWQGFETEDGLRGRVFDKNKASKDGVVFGDINGDFRSDYMYVGDNGNVHTWINNRGWGPGINPDWRDAGITHQGQGDKGIQGNIKFGRIYGSGRLDYIYLKEEEGWFDAIVWENLGGGGTKRKGDGVFYCDMRGTGSDDYVWIYQDGHAAEIFANIHQPPEWGHSTSISLNVPGPRAGIHLADWNGDGKCDVLVQNKATGALTLYENRFDAAKNSLTFVNVGVVSNPALCDAGWGVSIFDRGMRLADIDGDKRADVLCLHNSGLITAWLNTKSGMVNVGQVKRAEGWDRANLRFADVESSGRADIIWLNKYTGAGAVWKNNGHMDGGGGSSFSWTKRGVLYAPIDRSETMHFANLGGLGRADLHHVLPVSNTAYTYFNECGGGSGGDDGLITDPGLSGLAPDDYGDISQCKDKWSKFEDIPGDALLICRIRGVLIILRDILDKSLTQYDEIMKGSYDKKFGTYAEQMVLTAGESLTTFVEEHGNDYFSCEVTEEITCCGGCETLHKGECLWCSDGKVCSPPSQWGGEYTLWENKSEPCPPDYSKRGVGRNPVRQSVWYTLKGDKTDSFYSETQKNVGIGEDFIGFGRHEFRAPRGTSFPCAKEPWSDACLNQDHYFNFPYVNDKYGTDDVTDPKDLFTTSLPKWQTVKNNMSDIVSELEAKTFRDGDIRELTTALIFPILLVEASIVEMENIVKTADKIEKEKKKEFIMLWVQVLSLFIPLVGLEISLATRIGTTLNMIGRALSWLGESGSVASALYDIISTPENTPGAIVGFILGGAMRITAIFSRASIQYRTMDPVILATFGGGFVPARTLVLNILYPPR